jgi:hypothetical protein
MENNEFSETIRTLEESLLQLGFDQEDFQKRLIASINQCATSFNELRGHVLKRGFKTVKDEIFFFKVVKPHVYSKLLYYLEVYSIETKRPVVSIPLQLEYFEGIQRKIQAFFGQYQEFYSYYRSCSNLLDQQYFVRGKSDTFFSAKNPQVITDPGFNTSHDYILSKMKANEMLLEYIDDEIYKLNNPQGGRYRFPDSLYWTEYKVYLAELIYALHCTGAVNKGKATVAELVKAFQLVFNIDLGDVYRMFAEIRDRKKNRTKFLDLARDALNRRMDDADEYKP